MLNRRKSLESKDLSWQVKDAPCWLYNANILPSSRVFLPCIIKGECVKANSEYIQVMLDDQKYLMELKVRKKYLFQRTVSTDANPSQKNELLASRMKDIQEEEYLTNSNYDSDFGNNMIDAIKEDLYMSYGKTRID